jgi:Domain of unknown function (DUF5666)
MPYNWVDDEYDAPGNVRRVAADTQTKRLTNDNRRINNMKRRILAGIAILMAAIIGIGAFGATVASAQTPRPNAPTPPAAGQPVRLVGKVASVSANTLVLTTRGGDITVNIGADTFIVVQKNGQPTEGTAADLVAGKPATVAGVATSDPKVVDARMITQGAHMGGKPSDRHPKGRQAAEHLAAGTITAINGSTITLQGVKVPEVLVQTSANTVVLNNGFTTVSALKVGDKVAVLGAPEKPANRTPSSIPQSRTINAWGIRVENGTTQLTTARVEAVNGNTLTVKTPKNRDGATVLLDAKTDYKALTISQADRTASLADASQADVKVGSNLIIEGVASADGKSITAVAVVILPAAQPR